MPLSKFLLLNGSKKRNISKKKHENIKIDDETIKQIKDLIKIYKIVNQIVTDTDKYFNHSSSGLDEFKFALKILEQNRKVEKSKEDAKTEFDIWFNSRK